MDGKPYDSTVLSCQTTYYNLPTGWELAPADSDGIRIAGVGVWGASVVVYSNGYGHLTKDYGASAGNSWRSGLLSTSTLNGAPAYKPNLCNLAVLIRAPLSC
eukprot:scaffold41479_cov58-Phaeocystis_antarctica.AAC.1